MSETIPNDTPAVEPTLSAQHLEYLEFLFDTIPAEIQPGGLFDFETMAKVARNGVAHYSGDQVWWSAGRWTLPKPANRPETLYFTNYTSDAGILGTYRGPLCVWRLENEEIAVGVSVRGGDQIHQPELVPVLAELLEKVMAVPSNADDVDYNPFFTAWQNRVSFSEITYLWQRQLFGTKLPQHLQYNTGYEKFWSFLLINIDDPNGIESSTKYALGVMVRSVMDAAKPGVEIPVRFFEAKLVNDYGQQRSFVPIGLPPADLSTLPKIRKRVTEIIEAMKKALLEESLL